MAIQMRSKRGQIGATWLSRSLLERAETTFGTRGRAAGKKLARAGGVEWLEVAEGVARAAVTASLTELTHPEITLGPLRPHDIEAFTALVHRDASPVLNILAGTYDSAMEKRLETEGLALLPGENAQLSYACTCLAWPAVCEHVYAALYALIEHVDEAPQDYLLLLGIDVERLDLVGGGEDSSRLTGVEGFGEDGADGPWATVGPETLERTPAPASAPEDAPEEKDGDGAGKIRASGPGDSRVAKADEEGAGAEEGGTKPPAKGSKIRPGTFVPLDTNPALLTEIMSEDAAAVFAAFYASGSEQGPPESTAVEGDTP